MFVDEAGEGSAEGQVVDVAEGVDPEAAVPVDDDEAGGALKVVAAHGDWGGDAGFGGVDTNGERDAVLVEKCRQGDWGHGGVVFERGVQSQDGQGSAEGLVDPLCLGESV